MSALVYASHEVQHSLLRCGVVDGVVLHFGLANTHRQPLSALLQVALCDKGTAFSKSLLSERESGYLHSGDINERVKIGTVVSHGYMSDMLEIDICRQAMILRLFLEDF